MLSIPENFGYGGKDATHDTNFQLKKKTQAFIFIFKLYMK